MGTGGGTLWDKAIYRSTLQRWALFARRARTARLAVLRDQRTRARLLRTHLDQLIHTADERLALPQTGATGFPKSPDTDWAWRPALWRGPLTTPGVSSVRNKSKLGDEVTVFHDCSAAEITLRQLRNRRPEDLAPYGLCLDVFRFAGSFLSAVIDLPETAVHGLKRRHIFRVESNIDMENPTEVFVRLNVRHGPNTEQVVRTLPVTGNTASVEFDLAYCKLNEQRVEKAWVDFIFDAPEMNQITLRDLTVSRRLRAQV